MIVKCMLPLSIVENEAFKNYISFLDPSFNMPSRNTVKQSGVPQLKDLVYSKVKSQLKMINHPNVSVDGWTDDTMRSFNGFIAQGINDNWDLKVVPIDFKAVTGNY